MPKDTLMIYDPVEAQILNPDDLLRDVDQLADDDLLDLITEASALLKGLGVVVNQLQATMFHRMESDQATVRETLGYTVKLVPQRSYEYDLPNLLGLKYHLTGEQYTAAFKETVTPNKTELNKLVKLGGPIRQIIEASVREIPKPPKLEITPKTMEVLSK